jgi:hypothetical protein
LNTLEYKLPFGGDDIQNENAVESLKYLFYKSFTSIEKPESNIFIGINSCIASYGSIIKAVISKVKHKECKDHDYIIII